MRVNVLTATNELRRIGISGMRCVVALDQVLRKSQRRVLIGFQEARVLSDDGGGHYGLLKWMVDSPLQNTGKTMSSY